MAGVVSDDVALAARSTATVVILMGLNKLEEIMTIFNEQGKGDTPAAVIQNGTLKDQRKVSGTVSTIAERARKEQMEAPAIIVIGEVVRQAAILETLAHRAQSQITSFQ
jgi:uroporphyrin-III C-methyltransferase